MIKESMNLFDEINTTRFNKLDMFNCQKGLLTGVTDAIGLTDSGAQSDAIAASSASSAEAVQFQREQLAFTKEQYADWESVFGDLSKNLGDYYKNLSGTQYATKQVTAINKELQTAKMQTQKELARAGLSGSGAEAASITGLNVQGALSRAQARASADEYVATQKSGFLSLGLGQGSQYLGAVVQQAGNVGSAYNTATESMSKYAGTLAQTNQSGMNTLMGSATSGLMGGASSFAKGAGFMAGFSDFRLKNNIKYIKTVNGISLYTWDWNDEAVRIGANTYEPYGVIAQEVMLIMPDAVSTRNGYFYVDYNIVNELLEVNDGE